MLKMRANQKNGERLANWSLKKLSMIFLLWIALLYLSIVTFGDKNARILVVGGAESWRQWGSGGSVVGCNGFFGVQASGVG